MGYRNRYLCMVMPSRDIKTYIELHFVVLLLGFTGILGKLISLPAPELVVFRMGIAMISLFFILSYKGLFVFPSRHMLFSSMVVGLIIAAHWTTFFLAIKLSNVSVGLGILGVGTLFTAFMEPIISRKKISLLEISVGVIIMLGIYMIFRFESRYTTGIIFAIVSYFLSSLFSVLNKELSHKYNNQLLGFYEMAFGFLFALIALPFLEAFSNGYFWPNTLDVIYLLLLGVVCSAYAFAATITLMKKLSAYIVVLHINLEPIYAIVFAFFIFGESEHMTWGFYIGAGIVTLAVFLYPVLQRTLYPVKSTDI